MRIGADCRCSDVLFYNGFIHSAVTNTFVGGTCAPLSTLLVWVVLALVVSTVTKQLAGKAQAPLRRLVTTLFPKTPF